MQLSICIPTYLRAERFRQGLGQIRELVLQRQLQTEIEICICDDDSPDHTRDMLAAFDPKGIPFTCRHQTPNQGFGKALETAVSLATGDYLLLMGNDDELTSEGLDLILNAIQRGHAVTLFDTLPDRGPWGPCPLPAGADHVHLPDAYAVIGHLGLFQLTFVGNLLVRRADYLAHYRSEFSRSLYPQVATLLPLLQQGGADFVPKPLFTFEPDGKAWNLALLTAVDLCRVLTDHLFAVTRRHELQSTIYTRCVRSIPRAVLNEKRGRPVRYDNPYQALTVCNLLDVYRCSPRHALLAVLFLLIARVLPAPLLERLIGAAPRKVHFPRER